MTIPFSNIQKTHFVEKKCVVSFGYFENSATFATLFRGEALLKWHECAFGLIAQLV